MAQYPNRIERRKGQGKHPAYHSAACRKHCSGFVQREQVRLSACEAIG